MDFALTPWPTLDRAIWTVATILATYAVGLILNWLIVYRLQKLAAKTSWNWDGPVVGEVRKRIPLWSLLAGIWISVPYWSLPVPWGGRIVGLTQTLIILSVTSAIAAVTVRLLTVAIPRVNPEAQVSGLMKGIVRAVIFTIGLLVVLRGLDVEITPMLAALGVGGLAVALALQEVLSNLFAGLFVTFGGQMRMGDFVKLDSGVEGHIVDFKWRATILQTLAGNIVIVPNAKLSQAVVTNFTQPAPDMGITIDVTVAPDSDLRRVERLALDASQRVMQEIAGGVPSCEPTARFSSFTTLGITLTVSVRCQSFADHHVVRHETIKAVQSALVGAGVRLPSIAPAAPPAPSATRPTTA